jgi:heme a synthase
MVRRLALTVLALACSALALVVIVLGAYVRLSDAGLGCPDWPGCYGRLIAPAEPMRPELAAAYDRPLEVDKAWKEMIHRYAAALLGLGTVLLAIFSWRRRALPGQGYRVATGLVVLVGFQALLGMWTVTLLLKPLVVVLHLLGGLAILSLLWWTSLRSAGLWSAPGDVFRASDRRRFRSWAVGALAVLTVQVALGGWTSSNYAALACPDFPTCHGAWWPRADYADAFVLWRGIGPDYEGGVLGGDARIAIHFAHRVGAVITFLYIAGFAGWLLADRRMTGVAVSLLAALGVQVALGIANVIYGLPLGLAVAHNAGAAFLLLALVTVVHKLWPADTPGVGR